ncbi:sodium ABC transporter permease [Solibacillus sp. R5-41]|uniref:ABC transporter permease n=1 Tax=Solibacillus sp. R5-41 TaxID=2048654 RepID=UPI000C126BEE|nr:ABC transporter permease [Solibacillus sp. R5-41]ATP40577.1 sodium ABC transporter permease [Solibacillus sp. R5-41]
MSKFSVLVKQLYKQKVRTLTFRLMTLLYLGLICAFIFWPEIKGLLFSDDAEIVGVVNETNFDVAPFLQGNDQFDWQVVDADSAKKNVEEGEYYAHVTLTDDQGKLSAIITSFDPLPLNDQQSISGLLGQMSQMYAMAQMDLTAEQQEVLLSAEPIISMQTLNEQASDGKSTEEKQAGIFVSYAIGFVIYIFVATYLSMITTEVASEKGSRALEMLLVSVKPETHFRSKLVGVFLVAITQFTIIFGALILLLRFTYGGEKWTLVTDLLESMSIGYFLYVIGFLFGTILMYLILGALFGSLVSKVEEAGQVMMPALMMTLIGFYVMISGMGNPDTLLIKVFSYIPFTSGMVMPMRIGATDINSIEPIISFVLLVATTLLLYLISLTFYKRSVLTYSSGGLIQKIKTVFKVTT